MFVQPAPAVRVRRHVFQLKPVTVAVLLCMGPVSSSSAADAEVALPAITVTTTDSPGPASEKTGAYTVGRTSSATRLDLSPRETPQSVSVVTRAKMEDFRQNDINEALLGTPGVTVEKVETDRTYYTSRGFDIVNFQYDGVGLPLTFGNINGALDTYVYDRVEIVRGANGLAAATGNPSATVNFVRKRPTYQLQSSAGLTLGSWDLRRIEADISGPLTASGAVAGRLIVADQSTNSYLDRYSPDRTVFSGIVEANLSDSTLLTAGYTQQNNHGKGAMWGALPLYYSDGSPTNYPVSTSTAADWSAWNGKDQRGFAELVQRFSPDWQGQLTLNRNKTETRGKLFYVYGTPERATGLGLFSYPSLYDADNTQTLLDLSATGKFSLGGRRHDLNFGLNWSRSKLDDISHYGQGIGTPLPDLTGWAGNYPEPAFDAAIDGSSYVERRKSAYAAARFNLADDLKLLTGVSITSAAASGTAYGDSHSYSANGTSPYVGAIYDLTRNWSVYANATRIFNPQIELDINGNILSPIKGSSTELGFKGGLAESKLYWSAAVFRTQQDNTAEQAGMTGTRAYYRGVDARSQGVELEIAGELARGLQLSAGYTLMSIEDSEGNDVRTYVPRKLLRTSATYRLPALPKLQLGAALNWQSEIQRDQGNGVVTRQGSYALLNLMARYEIDPHLSVALNLNNVTDRKYLTSLYWEQAYYGAPRNASVTLNWKY